MGRAQYPGLWRFLDRAANSLDHVVWADVTHRGYAIVELTPDEVRADFWFVHPYDEDPAGRADRAAGFTTMARDWPPRFVATSSAPPPEPPRPGLPGRAATAPDPTCPRIRRHRRVRIATKATAAVAAAAAAVGVSVVALRAVVRRSR